MTTVLVEVTRGGRVESVHRGTIAVVDTAGQLVASAGDADHVAYFRSSAKPFQAVPLVERGAADAFGLTAAELALCCASHAASPLHQDVVTSILEKIGLGPAALRCGMHPPADRVEGARVTAGLAPPSPVHNNCSGKHAGMLAVCIHLGYPIDSYLDPGHPLQRAVLGIMAAVLRVPAAEIGIGTDGCSLPTFAASVRAFATAFAALAAPERVPVGGGREHAAALDRLRAAMASHPEHIGGAGAPDTDLIAATGGRVVAKVGAEGLICLALPEPGLGVAVRFADGSARGHAVAVTSVLQQLDLVPPSAIEAFLERQSPFIKNHNGIHVGTLRPVFAL